MRRILLLVGCITAFSCFDSKAGMFFWDVNSTGPGCGSATPTGTWGEDAYWNDDKNSGSKAWTDGAVAVFCGGDDATGTYTISISGTQKVADIHMDLGNVTFQGGALNLNSWDDNTTDPRLLSVGHKDPNAVARYNTSLIGAQAVGIVRYKRGTLIFGATNTYAGPTTVEGGILQLGVSQAIPPASKLVLANNDGRQDVANIGLYDTPATFATDGFSQKLGALSLAGPNPDCPRTIDFGNGASALEFEDSSAEPWLSKEGIEIPLYITNFTYGVDSLRFGTSSSALTPSQLALIQYCELPGVPATIDEDGYVTPNIPQFKSVRVSSEFGKVELTWSAINGRNYRLFCRSDLSMPWTYLSDHTASADSLSVTNNLDQVQRFYQVELLP